MKTDDTARVTTNAMGVAHSTSESYSFEMADNSMSPRYRQGATLYVDPAKPPNVGDDVVLWNRQRQRIVGELLEMTTPKMWRIEQLRADASEKTVRETIVELPVSEWPLCHRITGARAC
jgi:Peptidase S24-like